MTEGKLEFVLARIERLVGEMVIGADRKKETFSALFDLNDEIGRRARTSPDMKRNLIPLQQWVNALTVAVKSADPVLMKDSVARAQEALARLEEATKDRA